MGPCHAFCRPELTLSHLKYCPHLSATRIMRRRFLPSSLGLMLLGCGGKKIAQAARTLRTKSETGPFSCAESSPALTCQISLQMSHNTFWLSYRPCAAPYCPGHAHLAQKILRRDPSPVLSPCQSSSVHREPWLSYNACVLLVQCMKLPLLLTSSGSVTLGELRGLMKK